MLNCPTPHIDANLGDFAKTVLMPGDPLRAKFIAENFLTDARIVNNVRGIQGYTGFYNGVRISVMASGMGMPSIGIYSYELYNAFGVENIIRVGSAGALREEIRVGDIVIAMGASDDSNFAFQYHLSGTFAPICSYEILKECVKKADEMNVKYHVGNILSTDVFYSASQVIGEENLPQNMWGKMGVMAVEMETAALYMNAARSGKRALTVCTISDSLVTGECLSPQERETGFTQMIELALKTAISL
ncbi:MAG: purine-nucleoside phosphorylase [Clostridia bacterium]|nr:purine-nucleoside phosphorylase [Clostridia bacterium]